LFPPSFLLDPNIFDPRFLVPNVLLLIFYPHSWTAVYLTFALNSYAALGLVHTLNPLASGGAEHDSTKLSNLPTTFNPEPSHSDSLQAAPSASTSSIAHIPRGYGKIIRDSDGNVVRVELGADDKDQAEQPADGDEMQGLRDPEMDKQIMTNWVTELGGGRGSGAAIVQCELCLSCYCSFRSFSSSGVRLITVVVTSILCGSCY
jgi:hypothetical protein